MSAKVFMMSCNLKSFKALCLALQCQLSNPPLCNRPRLFQQKLLSSYRPTVLLVFYHYMVMSIVGLHCRCKLLFRFLDGHPTNGWVAFVHLPRESASQPSVKSILQSCPRKKICRPETDAPFERNHRIYCKWTWRWCHPLETYLIVQKSGPSDGIGLDWLLVKGPTPYFSKW